MQQFRTQEELADEVVERVLKKIGAEIRTVILQNLRLLPTPLAVGKRSGKLAWFVSNATKYQNDKRFGETCAQGLMQHSKLLKLSKMKASEFEVEVETAIATGQIERCCDERTGTMCYRIPGKQTPPAPRLEVPVKTLEEMDDPEQDSHNWEFGKALKKAREEREM